MSCLSGTVVERGMKTRRASCARGEPADRAEYFPTPADATHIADEVERGRLAVVLDGRHDGVGDCCKADLLSLVLRKRGRRVGE